MPASLVRVLPANVNRGGTNRSPFNRRRRPMPAESDWRNKEGTLFGWIDNPHSRNESLVLSHHSRITLAKENVRRCREDVVKYISKYIN